jgi:DNA-binding HxlR family transcriptional regulator
LAILSDAWAFLVLREFYLGARRFDEIQAVLHMPRSTLSDRLAQLSHAGLIERSFLEQSGTRFEYRLTEQGLDLYLVMLALLRFGDDHLQDADGPPLTLVHLKCGNACKPESVCSACGDRIEASRVRYRDGPGAGEAPLRVIRQRRRNKSGSLFERGRPSSVSRALEIMADRWTFLVLREFFFGARRYEQIRERLGIAPNTLADRLTHLVSKGILTREKYSDQPPRFEYRLSALGRELYLPLIQMLRWGDRWLGYPPPLILNHLDCGTDFVPVVVCDQCREPLDPRQVQYRLNYDSPQRTVEPRAMLRLDEN